MHPKHLRYLELQDMKSTVYELDTMLNKTF